MLFQKIGTNFTNGKMQLQRARVCSNHLTDGKPTFQKNPYPTLYLTPSESAEKRTEFNRSPKKRRKLERQTTVNPQKHQKVRVIVSIRKSQKEQKRRARTQIEFLFQSANKGI